MRRFINTISFFAIAACLLSASLMAQKQPVEKEAKGARIEYGNKRKSVVFYNDSGKAVKRIFLKDDTTKIGRDEKGEKIYITAVTSYGISDNVKYFGICKVGYPKHNIKDEFIGTLNNEHWFEYYNTNGKLLFKKKDALYYMESDDGSRVILLMPIYSEEYKKRVYELPEEDPKYEEYILVVDTLGRDIYSYRAKDIETFNFGKVNDNNFILLKCKPLNDIKNKVYIYIAIDDKKEFIIPDELSLKYHSMKIDENRNITFIDRLTKKVVKTVKYEDWK